MSAQYSAGHIFIFGLLQYNIIQNQPLFSPLAPSQGPAFILTCILTSVLTSHLQRNFSFFHCLQYVEIRKIMFLRFHLWVVSSVQSSAITVLILSRNIFLHCIDLTSVHHIQTYCNHNKVIFRSPGLYHNVVLIQAISSIRA